MQIQSAFSPPHFAFHLLTHFGSHVHRNSFFNFCSFRVLEIRLLRLLTDIGFLTESVTPFFKRASRIGMRAMVAD